MAGIHSAGYADAAPAWSVGVSPPAGSTFWAGEKVCIHRISPPAFRIGRGSERHTSAISSPVVTDTRKFDGQNKSPRPFCSPFGDGRSAFCDLRQRFGTIQMLRTANKPEFKWFQSIHSLALSNSPAHCVRCPLPPTRTRRPALSCGTRENRSITPPDVDREASSRHLPCPYQALAPCLRW